MSTEAGVLGAATGNGLATPDLEAKLDKVSQREKQFFDATRMKNKRQ